MLLGANFDSSLCGYMNIFCTFVLRAVQLNRDREKGNNILDKQPGLYARSSAKVLFNFS